MKRLLPALLAALCVAGPARADDASMVFGKENTISPPYDALEEVWFLLRPDGDCTKAWVDWEQGSTRVRVPLAYYGDLSFINDGLPGYGYPSGWAARLPVNHAGTAICSYTVVRSDGASVPHANVHGYEITENTTDPRGMTNQRCPNIFLWSVNQSKIMTGSSDGTSDWYGEELIKPSGIPQMIRLLGTTTDAIPWATKGRGSPVAGGFVRTTLAVEDGVGSIWFKARMANTNALGGVLSIERISYTLVNNKPKFNDPATEIAVVNVPPALSNDQWYQFHLILQDASAPNLSFRIRNKTMATNETDRTVQAVDVCDIVLTPVIPDVKIFKSDVDYAPGFPSIEDPVTFRVAVSNLYEGAPAEFITPRLVWRQGEDDAWHDAVMTNVDATASQQPGEYACVLFHDDGISRDYRFDDGPFEYFYEVSFAGYTPRFPALKYPRNPLANDIRNFEYGNRAYPFLIHTNDWAMLTDATGTNSECRSPAYYPDFARRAGEREAGAGLYGDYASSWDVVEDSPAYQADSSWDFTHLFDIRNLYGGWPVDREVCYATRVADDNTAYPNRPITIAADFPYLTLRAKDGVRRFRSLYTDLAAVTADWSTNVQSHLLPAYPMQHVGDYTWQAIVHISNRIDAAFSVTGALHAAEGGYDEGPFEWLEIDQEETNVNPPMSGALLPEHDSSLRRFVTHPVPREETNRVEVEVYNYDYLQSSGWFVGVVTNSLFYSGSYTNEDGSPVPPTEADVFWRWRLYTVEDPIYDPNDWTQIIGYEIRTNSVVIEENWFQDPAGGWYGVEAKGNATIQSFLQRPDRKTYTNENWNVVTGRVRIQPFSIQTNEIRRYTVHVPSEEDIVEANGGVAPQRLRTEVDIDYDGFLMYRFCTTNGSYQIRRAAWQDFNSWQADDRRYSRSAGLYDMKTFTWDVEGRPVTSFNAKRIYTTDAVFDAKALTNETVRRTTSLASGEPPNVADWMYVPQTTQPEPWTSSKGGNFYGYLGRRAQLILERTGRNATSTDRNGAFLLDTRPELEGSLETTSVSSDDGRDTLTMRVRSFSDDDRCITYNGGGSADPKSNPSASNYRVVARLTGQDSAQVSDGEHSLSLIGYYQDAADFWEARITQKSSLEAQSGGKAPKEYSWFEVHVYKWVDGTPAEVYGRVYRDGMDYGDSMNASMDANNRTGPNRVAQWPLWNDRGNVSGNSRAKDTGREKFTSKTKGGWTFVFDLQNEGDNVRPAVYAFLQDNYSTFDTNKNCYAYRCEATSGGTTYGRPGFNTKDCGLKIAPYVYGGFDGPELTALRGKNASGGTMWGAVPTSTDASWDHNNGRDYDQSHRIDVWNAVAQGSPSIIERKAPTVHYRVNVYRTELERIPDEWMDSAGTDLWNDNWDDYHALTTGRKDGVQTVASWRWQEVPIPMHLWDDTFVQVQALSADEAGDPSLALLALDNLECSAWRGLTLKEPEDNEGDDEISWIANYAMVEYDGVHNEGRKLELNRTRANPNRTSEADAQGVATPLLENGIGDVSFTYTVDNYPVRIRVGVLDRMGMFTTFADEELPVTSKSSPFYVYVATNITGRVYVLAQTPTNAAPGALGTLHVDNLRATDYPATGSTSWDIYNALVSTFPSNVSQRAGLGASDLLRTKFDGVSTAARSMRSAVLNDGKAEQTLNGIVYDESVPYLQTPTIETGVGEVSFWYCASKDNGQPTPTRPAQIRLMAADSPTRPFSEWTQLTEKDLYSDRAENPLYDEQLRAMAGLTNITSTAWTYFNVEFYKQEFRVLRIVAGDEDATVDTLPMPNRVMLDNVLITEPVRASIDVGTIRFVPDVPIVTRDTDARVTLVNPRMNPGVTNVVLEWFAAPGGITNLPIESVSYTTATNQTGPFYVPVKLPDGGTMQVPYYIPDVVTTENRWTEDTRVQGTLRTPTRMWGYEAWSNRWSRTPGARGGSITLTNTGESAYTYYTTEPIPTSTFDPDTVLQYCVKVEYTGRFNAPVYSELQGRTKNGYEFHNPVWYDPIDLNVAFGTTNWPVSHVFLFSCPTNTVFINEIRPAAKTTGPDAFVELMGPAGASVANWRLEHFGKDSVSGFYTPKKVHYTNVLDSAATFIGGKGALDKGWGFWVLGNYRAKAEKGDLVNQELFPPNIADMNNSGPMTVPGALRLRRSMGAYDNKVVWGQAARVSEFVQPGVDFEWAGNLTSGSLSLSKADAEGNWANAEFTWGDYNKGEEEMLPFADGFVPEARVPARLDRPVIKDISFPGENQVSITFQVRLDPEDVAAGLYVEPGDYNWYVDMNSELEDWEGVPVTQIGGEENPDDEVIPDAAGAWTEVTVTVRTSSTYLTQFYRIRAVPTFGE